MIPVGTTTAIRDQYLAPSLLAPFADEMARRVARINVGPLLETCADTGTLTQAIASAMSAGMVIIASDPRPDMIAFASLKPGMARVTWQEADPAALPFPVETFGIVTCQFGVATCLDRARALAEARRVMKPGGRFVFSVPAQVRYNAVADCLQDAVEDLFPGDSPRFVKDVLHGYADPDTIDNDLTEAGFTDAIYTSLDLPFTAASASDVAAGYCLGTPLRCEIEVRAPGESERVTASVAAALQRRFGIGLIQASMRAYIVSAAG